MEKCQLRRIEDIPWFHNLSRNSAEVMLLAYGRQGSYLIRPSKTNEGHYTVSVRSLDSVKHFSLRCEHGKFFFGVGEFYNIQELVEHFQNYPIIGGETGQPITLTRPYSCEIPEPPIYDDISKHAVCGKSFKQQNASTYKSGSAEEEFNGFDWSVASKEGFLTKQGGFHKNWKRRWFVTYRNTLKYYKERGDTKPIRVLELRLAQDVFRNNTCGKPNAFSLVFPFRTFFMHADSEAEMKEWIDLLTWKLDQIKDSVLQQHVDAGGL
ncbi:dual adapter for phosphotyrosine and 3-phosphotyrosine and 3-phosphoinositide-like isoform X2 [Montipora foliosa]|uniref:dual adapter for phosphotyrosine and 3-phosphotyrosine and 3-phosphoinositide-like isoform X2 n=1 Tax=Montipora foliosa TaxID=591990 RepID=UPI0035F20025